MARRMFEWLIDPAHEGAITVDIARLAAETARGLTEQGFEVSQDSRRWRVQVPAGTPDGPITFYSGDIEVEAEGIVSIGRLHDYWQGPEGPLVLGTYGDDSVFVSAVGTGLPCPVCSLLGGFHDRARHGSRVSAV